MRYRLDFAKSARKEVFSLDRHIQSRVLRKLNHYIISNEPLKFAEKLTDFEEGEFRFHIGEYRVTFDALYAGDWCTIYVLIVDNRKDIYRKHK